MIATFVKILKEHWILLFLGIIFLALIFRDPFSQRSLVPNFEPFPDALYYSVSAQSFLKGLGFVVEREGRSFIPSIPSLYPFVLSIGYIINKDPRFFYYVNAVLSLSSFVCMYMILKKITKYQIIALCVLTLYVSNNFFYWFPELAMAENLLLPLFLFSVYIFLLPKNKWTMLLASILPVAFYATKYASMPLTISYAGMYGMKIWIEVEGKKREKLKHVLTYGAQTLIVFICYGMYEQVAFGRSILSSLLNVLFALLPHKAVTSVGGGSSVSWAFSPAFFVTNFPWYWKSLHGAPQRFLWDSTPMLSLSISSLGFLGLFLTLLKKNKRMLSLSLLCMLISIVLFMSIFYSPDNRYIYTAIPTLLIGLALFFNLIIHSIKIKYVQYVLMAIIVVFSFLQVFPKLQTLRSRASVNFKYAETPWWYVATLRMNDYFSKLPQKDKKPVLITAMAPFLIDFYSNRSYTLLPLSPTQEFPGYREQVWGKQDYSDFDKLFASYIDKGYDVYLTNYGIGNVKELHRDFDHTKEIFNAIEVDSGCYNLCNIYKLSLDNSKKVDK